MICEKVSLKNKDGEHDSSCAKTTQWAITYMTRRKKERREALSHLQWEVGKFVLWDVPCGVGWALRYGLVRSDGWPVHQIGNWGGSGEVPWGLRWPGTEEVLGTWAPRMREAGHNQAPQRFQEIRLRGDSGGPREPKELDQWHVCIGIAMHKFFGGKLRCDTKLNYDTT